MFIKRWVRVKLENDNASLKQKVDALAHDIKELRKQLERSGKTWVPLVDCHGNKVKKLNGFFQVIDEDVQVPIADLIHMLMPENMRPVFCRGDQKVKLQKVQTYKADNRPGVEL